MKLRICGAILLCVVVLVGAVACSGGATKAPNGMTASEILERYQNASDSINTLHSDMTCNMSAMGETINVSISMSTDKPNRKLYELQTASMLSSGIECYILDNWIYMSSPTTKVKWVKTTLTEDLWNQAYDVNQELAVLNNPIDTKYIGMEVVGGTNCYKININPNVAAIIDAFDVTDLGNVSPSDAIKSFSCTAWIDESTYYLLKMSCDMTLADENSTMVLNLVAIFSNINQPVDIVLPAAAQNATAVNYSQFISGKW